MTLKVEIKGTLSTPTFGNIPNGTVFSLVECTPSPLYIKLEGKGFRLAACDALGFGVSNMFVSGVLDPGDAVVVHEATLTVSAFSDKQATECQSCLVPASKETTVLWRPAINKVLCNDCAYKSVQPSK